MPEIEITDRDILAHKELEADWYILEVTEISEKWELSKNGNNQLVARFTVKGPKDVGVSFKHWFPEASMGENYDTLVPFLNCFTAEGKPFKRGDKINTAATKGKLFEGWCVYQSGQYSGNRVQNFQRYKGAGGRSA